MSNDIKSPTNGDSRVSQLSRHSNSPITHPPSQNASNNNDTASLHSQKLAQLNNGGTNVAAKSPPIQEHQQQQQQQQKAASSNRQNSLSSNSFLPPINQTPPLPQNSQNSLPTISNNNNKTATNSPSSRMNANNYNMSPVNAVVGSPKNKRIDALDNASLNSFNSTTIRVANYYGGANNSKSDDIAKRKNVVTANSNESNASKKIVRWHLWWDKTNSNIRVPSYNLPSKNVPSKIGSLENLDYKPGEYDDYYLLLRNRKKKSVFLIN